MDEFFLWLGEEFRQISLMAAHADNLEPCQGLIQNAIKKIEKFSTKEQILILETFHQSHSTGIIGAYRLPFDMRSEIDLISALLGTIEDFLKDLLEDKL